jgi:hypothetical protein
MKNCGIIEGEVNKMNLPPTLGPTISQVLEEFLNYQQARLAKRTYDHYKSVVRYLRVYLEDHATPSDPALAKAVDEAWSAGTEWAFCSLCPPGEIIDNLDGFLGAYMVGHLGAGQDLIRYAKIVTVRLGNWLGEQNYLDGPDAAAFEDRAIRLGRLLSRAVALRDRLPEWVESQLHTDVKDLNQGLFEIEAISANGWKIRAVDGGWSGNVLVPSKLRVLAEVGWEVQGGVDRRPRSLRWIYVWNVFPKYIRQ